MPKIMNTLHQPRAHSLAPSAIAPPPAPLSSSAIASGGLRWFRAAAERCFSRIESPGLVRLCRFFGLDEASGIRDMAVSALIGGSPSWSCGGEGPLGCGGVSYRALSSFGFMAMVPSKPAGLFVLPMVMSAGGAEAPLSVSTFPVSAAEVAVALVLPAEPTVALWEEEAASSAARRRMCRRKVYILDISSFFFELIKPRDIASSGPMSMVM